MWLEMIGLDMYKDNFRCCHIITRSNMEILKTMGRADLRVELGITKQGRLLLLYGKLYDQDWYLSLSGSVFTV